MKFAIMIAALLMSATNTFAQASRVWVVQLLQLPKGLACEASMKGIRPEAGGSYEIHIRSPQLIIVHSGGEMAGSATVSVDGKSMFSAPASNTRFGQSPAVVLSIPNVEKFVGALEKSDARIFTVKVGDRTFTGIAGGFSEVSQRMERCIKQMRQ